MAQISLWIASILSFFMPAGSPIFSPDAVELSGSYERNGPFTAWEWSRPRHGEVPFDSAVGGDAATGTLRSPEFVLPDKIHFFLSGFPSRPGLRIYLRDDANDRSLDLKARVDPGFKWRMYYWSMPSDWCGARVRFVAEDKGSGGQAWLGFTLPVAGGEPLLLSFARAASRLAYLMFLAGVFLLPGIAIAFLVSRRVPLDFIRTAATVLCGSGAVAYSLFWAYLYKPQLGKILSLAFLLAGVIVIALLRRKGQFTGLRETRFCLAFTLTAALLYASLGFIYTSDLDVGELAQIRYNPGVMPVDNLLPELLAERLYKGQSVRPSLFGFWHSSDRPPLQAAVTMMEFPVSPPISPVLLYQLLGIFLQCLSLTAVWILTRAAGLGNRYLVPILGFSLFSTFCVFHSFFLWPKLLAAGFLLIAVSFVVLREWTWIDVFLASSALSLSMMSHMSVAFTVAPLAILIVIGRRFPSWKKSALALGILLLFLLPWRWYQSVYDPPGDYLLKTTLTDVVDENRIDRPLGELLKSSYRNVTTADWLATRQEDLKALYTSNNLEDFDSTDWHKALTAFSSANFFQLFWVIGLLNVAFIMRFFAPRTAAVRFADLCLLVTLISGIFWIVILYRPGATLVHQWSLANILLIFVALVIYIVETRPQAAYPMLALQILIIFPLFVFAKPFIEAQKNVVMDSIVDPGMAAFALTFFGAILFMGWRAKLQGVA